MYEKILIRFGELSTKGKNKMSFVYQLSKNIQKLVKCKTDVGFDRIFTEYSPEIIENLSYVFGIQSFSPVITSKPTVEDIFEKIKVLINSDESAKTFKVSVKRHWKGFPGKSTELNPLFGGMILKEFSRLSVDVHKPDLHIEVEIREDYCYIFFERISGLGGYPVGINGKVLHLISGGIDSPVAAFLMMKRGIHIDYVNFITPPHTDAKTLDKVERIITLLNKYQGTSILYRNHYTDLMNLIGLISNQSYKITLMRRSFYRLVSRLAIDKNYLGISNGEQLGQVASQTPESLNVIGSQATLEVFRPVITYDKLETIAKAEEIGTLSISNEQAYEACELFAPTSPVTKPKILVAEKLEQELETLFEMEEKNYLNNFSILNFNVDKN